MPGNTKYDTGPGNAPVALDGKHFGWAIRNERYRMVQWGNPTKPKTWVYELYDYSNGPIEKVNIADQNPKIIAEMRKEFDAYPTPVMKKHWP